MHYPRLFLSFAFVLTVAGSSGVPASAQTNGLVFHDQIIQTTFDFGDLNVNSFLGATTFYSHGFTGTNAIAANIEAGFVWGGHEVFNNSVVYLPVAGGAQEGQFDTHATYVGSAIAGRPTAPGNEDQRGIAYGATLWSGAIATQWNSNGSFEASDTSLITPYLAAMRPTSGPHADVINGSYGYNDPPPPNGTGTNVSGADRLTVAFDGLAASTGVTLVWAAGNSGPGINKVSDPAAGYNSLSVGALQFGADPNHIDETLAAFSSAGPSDFQGPGASGTVVPAVRARVDLVAPGDDLRLASYRGATGENAGANVPTPGPNNLYDNGKAGTSFAAPIVAGGVALLADVGHTLLTAVDTATNANVIKAVLLNSADRLPGWNNGQTTTNGVVTTTQALDYGFGAGRMDLTQAYAQYVGGVTDVTGTGGGTNLATLGWDYGTVLQNSHNDYFFSNPLSAQTTFTGTLNWFVDRTFDGLSDVGDIRSTDAGFTNLNLELWRVLNGAPTDLVARSSAPYINTQHFVFDIPTTDSYMLRVAWAGDMYGSDTQQSYAVAWSGVGITASAGAPEPSTGVLILAGTTVLPTMVLRRRRRSA